MSSLVLLGEQPLGVELAQLLERLQAGSGLAALATAGKLLPLLEQGVLSAGAAKALQAANDEDFVSALTLAFAVLAALPAAEAAAATPKLAALLTAEPLQRSLLKVRTLAHLLNVVGNVQGVTQAARFALLLQLLEFALQATPYGAAAASANAAAAASAVTPAALVLQSVAAVQKMIAEWKLAPADATALLLANYKLAQRVAVSGASAAARSAKSKADDLSSPAAVPTVYSLGEQPSSQQEYLYALLQSLDSAAPATLREKQYQDLAIEAALHSAANGIAQTLHQLDPTHVFQLAAVQALSSANNATGTAAFELLRILVDADLPGWVAFQKGAGAALLKEHAARFDADVMLRKVRTLALAALAVEQQGAQGSGDNVLTYAQLSERLQLAKGDNEAVEAAVIDAVMAGRIDAKMDQDAETLVVKRVTGGVPLSLYTGPQSAAAWANLGARLAVWRENIHSVLQTLSAQHQQQGQQDDGEEMQ